MSNVNDLPQYAIDDIALEYNAEPAAPTIVTPENILVVVGNVLTCTPPLPLIPVCIPANKYTVTVPESQRATAQAYVNGKAQADLNNQTHFGTFTYPNLITVPGSLLITPPPVATRLAVSGLQGVVSQVILLLDPLTHVNVGEAELMLLLQSATGQVTEIMWNCGTTSPRVDSINLTIQDTGSAMPTDLATPLTAGTYKPSSRDNTKSMGGAAPGGPYALAMSTLNGTSPNGTWTLWGSNFGGIPGENITFPNGFQLQITTV